MSVYLIYPLFKKVGGGHLVYSLRMDGQVGHVRNSERTVFKRIKKPHKCVRSGWRDGITCLCCDLGVGMNKNMKVCSQSI